MKKTKFHDRYTVDFETVLKGNVEDAQGNLFISDGFQWNSDTMKILHSGVDTIKQLYSGLIERDMLAQIQAVYDRGYGGFVELLSLDGEIVPFMVSSGRKGGYKFTLLNQELGVVILLGSTYVKDDLNGSHLKIELSPHLIMNNTSEYLQSLMDNFAKSLLTQVLPSGVALHLCCDFQGVDIPDDLDRQLTTRTRRTISRTGLSEIDIPLMASKYGASQSFLFGRADSVQFAVYRKDIQAKEQDKTHIWHVKWSEAGDRHFELAYNPELPVWRVELRFHHTAIDELGRDKDLTIKTFMDAVTHLTGFWRYGLDNCYRWDMNHRYIHPAWQYLIESVFIPKNTGFIFTRRLKKLPGEGNQKNIALAYGNLLSIYARNRFPVKYVMRSLRDSGMWRDLFKYWQQKTGLFDDDRDVIAIIMQDVENKLKQRRIGYGIAA
ncbi:MAG: hypothetical protein EPN89_18105 [Methylovulum sp.]|nr:MAG: hypothetical protein EPN89_18105 [Methylovulum sp.]